MPRFSRNLIIAQCVLFVVTQVAMVWLGLPVFDWLAVGGEARLGPAWQWLTHPFVESVGNLISFALAMLIAYYTFPRIEATYGRSLFLVVYFASVAMGGLLGLGTAALLAGATPASGAFPPVLGLFAFDAWTRRNGGRMRILPFVVGPSFDVTGRQLVAGLLGFSFLLLLLSAGWVPFAVDVGCILGGVAASALRERWRTVRRTKLSVVRGGRNSGDGMLH